MPDNLKSDEDPILETQPEVIYKDIYRGIDTSNTIDLSPIKLNYLGHMHERMFVTVDVYGRKVRALVDCGASRTIINSNLARTFVDKENLITYENSRTVHFADKTTTRTNGSLIMPINVSKALWVGEVYMLDKLQYQMILGIDFLRGLGFDIDFNSDKIKLPDGTPVEITNEKEDKDQDIEIDNLEISDLDKETLKQFLSTYKLKLEQVKGCTDVVTHKVKLKPGTEPIKQRWYPQSPVMQDKIEKMTDEMLKNDIIEESKSGWSSPIFLVPQGDEHRFIVDFRALNAVSEKDAYPNPNISEILSKLRGSNYITSLDLKNGYHQMLLDLDSRDCTSFTIPGKGLYRFKRTPFGLHSAGASFQRLMDRVLGPVLQKNIFCYQDDIIIVSKTFAEHMDLLKKVFELLINAGLKLNLEKCSFCQSSGKFLGFVVRNGNIEVDPD